MTWIEALVRERFGVGKDAVARIDSERQFVQNEPGPGESEWPEEIDTGRTEHRITMKDGRTLWVMVQESR